MGRGASEPQGGAASVSTLIEQFAPVAEELERASEDLIDRITIALRAEVPSMRPIASAALREFASVHVRRGLEATRGSGAPSDRDLAEAAVVGREAARFGIPADELLQAMRVGVRIFWLECVEVAAERELDPATLIEGAELIWGWADAVGLAAVRGHRETAVEESVYLERQRCAFLVGALQGSISGSDLRTGADLYGLRLDRDYVPLRARAFGAARSPAQCERALRHAFGPAVDDILVCTVGDDLAGIVPERPEIDDPQVLIGVGRAARLPEIVSPYADAVRAIEVATRFGLRGVVSLEGLSLRAPVASETALGERLVSRYLAPLRNGTRANADLERTVRTYVEQNFHAEETANSLHIHMNTLRNRLRRIEDLTGLNFRNATQIAELWWALQYDSQGYIKNPS